MERLFKRSVPYSAYNILPEGDIVCKKLQLGMFRSSQGLRKRKYEYIKGNSMERLKLLKREEMRKEKKCFTKDINHNNIILS